MPATPGPPLPVTTVEALLTAAAGLPVRLADAEALHPGGGVWRCRLVPTAGHVAAAVIVKAQRTDPGDPRSAHPCIATEHAALTYMQRLGLELAPRALAADARGSCVILEDRGALPSLPWLSPERLRALCARKAQLRLMI